MFEQLRNVWIYWGRVFWWQISATICKWWEATRTSVWQMNLFHAAEFDILRICLIRFFSYVDAFGIFKCGTAFDIWHPALIVSLRPL